MSKSSYTEPRACIRGLVDSAGKFPAHKSTQSQSLTESKFDVQVKAFVFNRVFRIA